jgi:hypothetical protein
MVLLYQTPKRGKISYTGETGGRVEVRKAYYSFKE